MPSLQERFTQICRHALPDNRTLQRSFTDSTACASLLRSCVTATALPDGKRAHHHIIMCGLDHNLFLWNLLIQMYANCVSLENASASFCKMHRRDRFSWNFMITAYAQKGKVQEAFQLFNQMQCEGVFADKFVFVSILSACASPTVLAEGKRVHVLLICSGTFLDAVVGTALVNMYGKCGELENAQEVFAKISERDVVSWNAMIAVYAHLGRSQNALSLFEQMQRNGVTADKFTFVTVLSACASQGALAEGRVKHRGFVGSGLESDIVIGNALINMYGKCGCPEDAKAIYDQIPEHNTLSWTAMIAAFAQHGHNQDALQLLEQMQWEGLVPDDITFVSILSTLHCPSVLDEGKRMHARILGTEFESDMIVVNALLNMYIKCGSLEEAQQIFDKMPMREAVSWTAMTAAYVQHGQGKHALELFEQMKKEGVVLDEITFISIISACSSQAALVEGKWMHACIISSRFESDVAVGNALISMYSKCGCLDDALTTFEKMQKWDDVTFISILSACASQASLTEGKCVHACIMCSQVELDPTVGNAILSMYGRCGSLVDARWIFDRILKRNLAIWNAMIAAYAQVGEGKHALQLFDLMRQERVMPDEATFVSVLSACSHTGLVDEGSKHFISMHQDYGITPEVDHYNCMVDLLGRVGRLDEAEDLIRNMPLQPTGVSWMTLLGACRTQVDVERGQRAAMRAFELDPKSTAPYVTMSNLYATVGRGDDAARVMEKMKTLDLKKQGTFSSLIDVESWMHTFRGGYQLHLHPEELVHSR